MRPFAGRDRVVGIDACVRPAAGVDTDPFSCPQRDAFASKQEAGILYDPSQLREHLTGDEVLMHGRDWIVLKAMLLRCDRMSGQHRNPGAEDFCSAAADPGIVREGAPTHARRGCQPSTLRMLIWPELAQHQTPPVGCYLR